MLAGVGARVRALRATQNMSRKSLAEISRISPRYLAQLESGQGNISISLLYKVAQALGQNIGDLVTGPRAPNGDDQIAADLFSRASHQQRQRVLKILGAPTSQHPKAGRIALIGLRGAGKSTIGPLLAENLGLEFIELNDVVKMAGGIPVAEVFELYGEEGYRRLEQQSLDALVRSKDRFILAVGGGVVADSKTFNFLLKHYHTIWLRAKPEDHMQRVQMQGDQRPMTGNPDAMADLRSILTARERQYAKADFEINTSDIDISSSVKRVLSHVAKHVPRLPDATLWHDVNLSNR